MTAIDSIAVEFDGLTAAEFADVKAELAAALADIQAGRCDAALARSQAAAARLATLDDFSLRKGQQMSGLEAPLILLGAHAGAKVATKVVLDIWTSIVLPRLRRRYGARVRTRGDAGGKQTGSKKAGGKKAGGKHAGGGGGRTRAVKQA